MTYRVNTKNLLFDDLTDEEAQTLEKEVSDLVLRGNQCWNSLAFKAWCAALEYDERQTLLVMATSYPQRALLSLVRRTTLLEPWRRTR